ncbi:MAG: hypothetical protein ACI9MB_002295, partial [Verrucomicrobiales bacterium]
NAMAAAVAASARTSFWIVSFIGSMVQMVCDRDDS